MLYCIWTRSLVVADQRAHRSGGRGADGGESRPTRVHRPVEEDADARPGTAHHAGRGAQPSFHHHGAPGGVRAHEHVRACPIDCSANFEEISSFSSNFEEISSIFSNFEELSSFSSNFDGIFSV